MTEDELAAMFRNVAIIRDKGSKVSRGSSGSVPCFYVLRLLGDLDRLAYPYAAFRKPFPRSCDFVISAGSLHYRDGIKYEEGFTVNSRGSRLFTCKWTPMKLQIKALIFICHGTSSSSLISIMWFVNLANIRKENSLCFVSKHLGYGGECSISMAALLGSARCAEHNERDTKNSHIEGLHSVTVWEHQLAAEIDKGDHTFGSRTGIAWVVSQEYVHCKM
ncbi:hypothetical protein QYE76_014419 [Lolium multiflorum]|uniref:Uncharacterized protein n=1 Tax=Lolium multiflorum TaxID=4521 RepID=A0AAD8U4S3_LOLMU|nr:hypothetical protein QYE76_014419 [Lolium multiflorum]